MEKMSSIIRREFKKGDDIRDAGLTAPDDVIRYKDIAYGKDSAMQVLDVYRPKDTEGILPVDRFFHCMQISVRMQSMQKNMISRYRKD